jgi:hypothetical protein
MLRPLVVLALACAASSLSLDAVICHLNEDQTETIDHATRALEAMVHVTESHVFLVQQHTDQQFTWPPSWEVMHTPNLAREEHCYFKYLIHYSGRQTDLVWFTHPTLDGYAADKFWPRLSLVTPRTGMLALAWMIFTHTKLVTSSMH